MREPSAGIVLAALLIGACGLMAPREIRAAEAGAGPHRELVLGLSQYPNTFHPSINSMMAKSFVLGFTRLPIAVHDAQWRLVCMMCTELPTIENGLARVENLANGKKGIAVTFTLVPGAKWGDGAPMTADDVLFTWEVGRHPLAGVSNFELYKRIARIDVHDARRFTLHLDRLTFDYNAIGDFAILPAHLERAAFADPARYKNRTLYDTDTANPGLYAGPYTIAQTIPGAQIVLARNPHWWGKTPYFDRIVLRFIENSSALAANLRAGAVDYIPGEIGLTLDQALAFERRFGKDFDFIYTPGLIYEHVDFNLDNPILADLGVRRALLHAIDREGLSRALFGGHQKVADGFVSPLDWIFASDLPQYPYDPERAERLLDEAGWKRKPDGVRRNAQGRPLTLEFMTSAGDHTREMVQQVLQSEWRRVGVDVRIRNQPARILFGDTTNMRKFSAMVMYAWFSAPENVPRTSLHSSMIPSAANNYAGQNFPGFRDPAMDAAIDRTETELDPKKRAVLWREIQRIYATELPVLPLYFRASAYIFPHWLKGIEPTGHQYPTSLWVENWRVETPQPEDRRGAN